MDNFSQSNAISFCLLPSDLIQNIILYLALPEIMGMKMVNKSIAYLISDQNFVREINLRSKSASWLFIYKKRWRRNAVLQGFSDQSTRWFNIAIADMLNQEDLYFLTASGNIFLFVSNTKQRLIAVDLVKKTVKIIPPSPLGPRGTSSWRRSGMKLVAASVHFRFMFAELVENRPVLFEYSSETDTWRSMEGVEPSRGELPRGDCIFLNAINRPNGSTIIAVDNNNTPLIVRPRFDLGGLNRQQIAVGLSNSESVANRLHVYGDGHLMVVESVGIDRVRKLIGVQLWGLNQNGETWEYICRAPGELINKISKPYGVMMGCLEKADSEVKMVIMSNHECVWQVIWLLYDTKTQRWTWIPLPDCNMRGSNMAGIALCRGLTLS